MKRKITNASNGPNRLFGRLAADRKKTTVALCMIAVMAFMWVRVFTKETPTTAEATLMAQQGDLQGQPGPQARMSFIELPEVAGRNDVLTRDFFDSDGWRSFAKDREENNSAGNREVSGISGHDSEKVIAQVAQKLQLEAIVLGENPQAFINDKLLLVGDRLLVEYGGNAYECEVVRVEERAVFMRCGQAQIKLRL